jgi:hypothetical protein
MSNQAANTKANGATRRERIRVRVDSLRRAPKFGILGLPEIIALGTSLVVLLVLLFSYLYFYAPARARHTRALEQRDGLQKRLRDAQGVYKPLSDTGATVTEIAKSLQDFEETRLSPNDEGRMAIYQELNELIRRNALRTTGGVNYSSLDPVGTQAQRGTGTSSTSARSGNSRWQSVYPGLGVSLTVEGAYANLRRFVRDIEASRQFVIINAVELEGASDTASRAAAAPNPGGAIVPPASIVSLRLDMAAYFRRAASNPESTEPQQQQGQPEQTGGR